MKFLLDEQADAGGDLADGIEAALRRAVSELNLDDRLQVEREESPGAGQGRPGG